MKLSKMMLSIVAVVTVAFSALAEGEVGKVKVGTFACHVYAAMKQRSITLEQAVAEFKAAGVTGFQSNIGDEEHMAELQALGMVPVAVHGCPKFRDPAQRAEMDAKFLACVRRFGMKKIMVVVDSFKDLPVNDPDDPEYEREFVKTIEGLKDFVAKFNAEGVEVSIEDFGVPNNPCSWLRNLRRYFDAIPNLKFTIDTGNVLYANHGDDILDEFQLFLRRLTHVHLKDHPNGDRTGYALPGAGVVPNAEILRRLYVNGYDGWVILEIFGAPDMLTDIRKSSEFVNSCAVEPVRPLLVGVTDAGEPPWNGSAYKSISGTSLSYVQALGKVGHVPIIICRTYDTNMLERVIGTLDMILLTGGRQDVDPGRYGEKNRKCGGTSFERDRFDSEIVEIAVRKGVPILGVCRGIQFLNVYFGGSLCQDIRSEWEPKSSVRHGNGAGVYTHTVNIEPDSRLARLIGVTNCVPVNSMHHQCVKRVAEGFKIVARSPDGVPEAMEHQTLPIAAVQFHPEDLVALNDDPTWWRFYRYPLSFVRGDKAGGR